jgi:phosphoglycerate dehydrogenase-like enzyme
VRPTVVVLGPEKEPPPGIDAADRLADLRYGDSEVDLRSALTDGAAAVYAWDYESDLLPSVWDSAQELRWIQTASAGVDRLLFPDLVASDILVTNARGVFERPMAEAVIGMIIAFAKDLATTIRDTDAKRWHHRDTEHVAGKRLVVVGPGPIGRAAGRAAGALGMEVEAVGTSARDPEEPFSRIRGRDELGDALGSADYVLNAAPLTRETRHLFDARAFAAMKPTARFLNVGRGATVDTDALVAALVEGRIAGAGLDVFEEEPLPTDHPLWEAPNVIISPHMAGDTDDWEVAVVRVFLDNLERFVEGKPLINLVDKERGYGASG